MGLVIERERMEGEMDCLRWYQDFENCQDVLFERYFTCNDLGRDLVPVVQEFKASKEFATGQPLETSIPKDPPLKQVRSGCVCKRALVFARVRARRACACVFVRAHVVRERVFLLDFICFCVSFCVCVWRQVPLVFRVIVFVRN